VDRRRIRADTPPRTASSDQLDAYFATDNRGGALKCRQAHVSRRIEETVDL
jgi:hypothetical protein